MRISAKLLGVLALTSLLLPLVGCGGGSAEGGMDSQIPLGTVQETVPVRGEDVLGVAIDWTPNQQVPVEWGDISGSEKIVQDAISDNSARLTAIDYVALSLPQWVTYTRSLTLKASDFTGQGAHIDAHGQSASDNKRWLLYEWQGPEYPQDPTRPIVHRWVTIYALYDVEAKSVTRLAATIRGVVYE